MNQTAGVLRQLGKKVPEIKIATIKDDAAIISVAHIITTTSQGFRQATYSARGASKIEAKNIEWLIYDEADEFFSQDG